MRFLADMGISQHTISWLHRQGFDAVHLRDENLQRLSDNKVLAKAAMENRVLLTMDLDFGYLVAISKQILPGVIIFRLSDERSEMATSRLSEVLVKCAYDIQPGVIISVSDRTIRIRRLPI
ncbi:DUF5615 family PIN-like protein [Syntrophomonas wolfei]|uniref:DUF5615 family PIN-like protein n=1 Tax=Syntrophomonas wolfei TaxID=863 RepID=UPI0023F24B47|nr:DUF5615 family PIN-like protein [Syntrophomonas wolfei]